MHRGGGCGDPPPAIALPGRAWRRPDGLCHAQQDSSSERPRVELVGVPRLWSAGADRGPHEEGGTFLPSFFASDHTFIGSCLPSYIVHPSVRLPSFAHTPLPLYVPPPSYIKAVCTGCEARAAPRGGVRKAAPATKGSTPTSSSSKRFGSLFAAPFLPSFLP
jgi:hypothetical protein